MLAFFLGGSFSPQKPPNKTRNQQKPSPAAGYPAWGLGLYVWEHVLVLLAELVAALRSPCPIWGLPSWAAPFGTALGLPPQAQSKKKSTRCRCAGAYAVCVAKHTAVRPVLPDSPGAHMAHCWDCCKWLCPTAASTGLGQKKTFRHTLKAKCANSPTGTYRVYFCTYTLLKSFAAEPELPSLIASHTRRTTAVNKHGDELLCVNTADKLQSLPLSYTSSNHFCGFT